MDKARTKRQTVGSAGLAGPASLAVLAVTAFAILPAYANPVSKLAGRWTGWGAVTLASGGTERVKCVATYFIKNKGANVRQNLRCASANYKIDTVANYLISGKSVSGTWEERKHSNSGIISGSVTAKGFKLSVTGEAFTATMSLTTGKCKQSISFAPKNLDVTHISIGLRKC